MTLEYIPKISIDKVYNLLPIDYREHTKPADIKEFDDTSKKELVKKRFYKLKLGESEIIHLTLGKNLKNVFNKTKSFYKECPEYACKPLFISTDQVLDLLGQEFFEGTPIDEKYASNEISDEDVGKIVTKIQKIFSSLEVESTSEAFREEFNEFKETILSNNSLHLFDKDFLNNCVFPHLEDSLLPKSFSIRWSPGDLAARNILIDDDLNIRIIDCEFAHQTHFHDEDWIRLAVFSSGNFKEIPNVKQRLDQVDPWYHTYLSLRQTWLNRTIWQNDDYKNFASKDLYTLLKLSESFDTNNKNVSLLIRGVLDAHRKSLNEISVERNVRIQKEKALDAEKQLRFSKESELVSEKELRLQKEKALDAEKQLRFSKESELVSEKELRLQKEKELLAERELRFQKENELLKREDKIHRMQSSFSWIMTRPLRLLRRIFIDNFRGRREERLSGTYADYTEWVQTFDTLNSSQLRQLVKNSEKFTSRPCISIVMPVHKPKFEHLVIAINSVLKQTYENWELCIVDDASESQLINEQLTNFARSDKRIKFYACTTHGHISRCSNIAAEKTKGEFIAFLDHDDVLPPHSLHYLVETINLYPRAKLIYSDEDKINEHGERYSPFFKPDWNPELLKSQNYICHFTAISSKMFKSVGGFRVGFEGSQDWDLFLRVTEKISEKEIIHIPKILYHWRASSTSSALNVDNKNYAKINAQRALEDHHSRINSGAIVNRLKSGYFTSNYFLPKKVKGTIIIPTRDGSNILEKCLNSIYNCTNILYFNVILIDNGSRCPKTLNIIRKFSKLNNFSTIVETIPFNYSALNNKAVKKVDSNICIFLNDDTEIITEDWLDQLMANAARPEIGAVGAKLLYPNETIQHAGVILGIGGVAGHAFKGMEKNTAIQMNRANISQNISAVTGACLAVQKTKFEAVNGFDEKYLKVAFNDVDLCLKLVDKGFKNLYLPQVVLRHYESYSRGLENTKEKKERFQNEIEIIKKRWGKIINNDPFYNINLTLESENFGLTIKQRNKY